jgi:hypothetical protein
MNHMRTIRANNSFYVVFGPFFHKSLEIGWQKSVLGKGFEVEWHFKSRGDHAGLRSYIDWDNHTFEFNFTDDRHWNWESDRFNLPGEEKNIRAFEGYPHE